MKKISHRNFMRMCNDIKYCVEKNYDLPTFLEFDGVKYYQIEMAFALAYGLHHLKSDFTIPNFGKWTNLKGEAIDCDVKIDEIKVQCKRVYNHILKKAECPSSVLVKADKDYLISTKVWIYAVAKTIVYYEVNMKLPKITRYSSNAFVKPTPKKSYSEEIFDYFTSKFGRPSSIDDALRKIQAKGYGFYYDDSYSNKTTIDRIKAGKGVNCTDVHQMLWHIGKVLGYEVRAFHVWCNVSNVGHVRLDFNRGDGWFSRDGASVLDGECVTCIWCSNGTVLAYNPSWFLSNVNR